ncbi:MAG TPA: hypothetical protein VNY07_04075, partial [Chthoniobacterales bacterium]|nr:hypothetical protein [Chthoniobacterales bacterium]
EESDCPEIPKPEERLKILLGERPDPKPDAEIRKDFRPPFWAFTFRNLLMTQMLEPDWSKVVDRRRMRRRCGQSERLLQVGTNQTDREETGATG